MKKRSRAMAVRRRDIPLTKASVKIWAVALGVLLGAGAVGCKTSSGFRPSASTEDLTGQYLSQAKDYSQVPVTDAFRQSYGDFSLRLLKESRQQAGSGQSNLLVSPLSVMTALEMTRSGARAETRDQMEQTLYGDAQPEQMKDELMAYLQTLPNQKKAAFHFANSIWYRREASSFEADPDFLRNSAADYGAKIYAAPFDQGTLHDINRWVEQETDGMIRDIIDDIPDEAVLYLINGMAFDAEWREPYRKDQIHEARFYPQESEPQTVEMMYSQEGTLIRGKSVKGFRKSYQDGYAFAALLPEEGISIDQYLEELSGEEFLRLLEQSENESVETGLPKFSVSTRLALKEVLEDLGMPLAFDVMQADFSGMGRDASGNIFIGQVIHSTFMEVDAKGTRAGAATMVEMNTGSASMELERVILNRPFLYAIVDTRVNLPIFIGILDTAE